MSTKQLSQSEIWDDSALVDSWNEALEEYKKYHSIAAKGERVEDVVAAADDPELAKHDASLATDGLPAWESIDEVEQTSHQTDNDNLAPAASINLSSGQQIPATGGVPSGMPQALLHTVQDESLKNLMMSWYYAGYYTGLYEGQQKAHTVHQDGTSDLKSG